MANKLKLKTNKKIKNFELAFIHSKIIPPLSDCISFIITKSDHSNFKNDISKMLYEIIIKE